MTHPVVLAVVSTAEDLQTRRALKVVDLAALLDRASEASAVAATPLRACEPVGGAAGEALP